MNSADLRELDDKGLLLQRQELLGSLTSLKFKHATGQLEDTSSLKSAKRDFARINSLIREREIAQGLGKGGLARSVGKLEPELSAFASFRKAMGQVVEG